VASSPGLQPVTGPSKQVFRFVARQPILNREQQVFGYELLFRDGIENFFRASDAEAAARSTLDSSLLMGFDVLCDGQKAFINCTRDLLLKDGIALLPHEHTVVEILENVEPDDLVMAACERLRAAGYTIALDDYVAKDPRASLTPIADFIKVDFERTTPVERAELVKRLGNPKCQMLAEKVETREQFETALKAGFTYFQGYFFRRPEVMRTGEITANQVNYLRMLKAVSHEEVDIRELEALIKSEASVLYRLLRYLNSPMFGMRNEIHSIRHALAILGEPEIRRWIRLVTLVSAGQLETSDLVLSALVRARFCELIARRTAYPIRLVPGGNAVHDGCNSGHPHGRSARKGCHRSGHQERLIGQWRTPATGVRTDAGAGGRKLGKSGSLGRDLARQRKRSGRTAVASDAVGTPGQRGEIRRLKDLLDSCRKGYVAARTRRCRGNANTSVQNHRHFGLARNLRRSVAL
jgi:c-di-GMP-related signal transduction protein